MYIRVSHLQFFLAKHAKYAYLGALIMVKKGVPEKILQNAVQTH